MKPIGIIPSMEEEDIVTGEVIEGILLGAGVITSETVAVEEAVGELVGRIQPTMRLVFL